MIDRFRGWDFTTQQTSLLSAYAVGVDRESIAQFLELRLMYTFGFQGLTMRQIRFRFDGQPINETDTPAQV